MLAPSLARLLKRGVGH